ncbi:MAG: esterase/lipase family protein [Burkholderiaceae bacterium]
MNPARPATLKPRHLRLSDVRGAARLAVAGTQGVTHIAQGVHTTVLRTLGFPVRTAEGSTSNGLTSFAYGSVRRVAGWVGSGIDLALNQLQPLLDRAGDASPSSPQREAVLAALNGVLGDQLEATENPLATPMGLRYQGQALNFAALKNDPAISGKIVLFVHGLCMNDLQWRSPATAQDHGSQLADALGYTPVYLRYNSGRHISANGHSLALQLQQLVSHWPKPVTELAIVAHSMGGLVVRSACAQAGDAGTGLPEGWLPYLKKVAFLGTPHHGAPLERAGHGVDLLLGATRWSAPFAKIGQLRSAGITDLRHGLLLPQDSAAQDRFAAGVPQQAHVPLPPEVACFAIAASTAQLPAGQPRLGDRLRDQWLGDGLVPLPSALGQHNDPACQLAFPPAHLAIEPGMGHLDLLTNARVTQRLLHWFAGPAVKA